MHKTTRGIEAMLRVLMAKVAAAAAAKDFRRLGLDRDDPLGRFFGKRGEQVENYLALDDFAVWATISRIARGGDPETANLAVRLLERRIYKALDINAECPVLPEEEPERTEARRRREIQRVEDELAGPAAGAVLKDEGSISIYGEIGLDQTKAHKMLSIRLKDDTTREITVLSPTIRTLRTPRALVRFYFPTGEMRDRIRAGGKI
jgi:hypothetical protein